jgi:hypothetical protein
MLELAEKTTIIAEMGQLLVAEIPKVRTEPGGTRITYEGECNTFDPV